MVQFSNKTIITIIVIVVAISIIVLTIKSRKNKAKGKSSTITTNLNASPAQCGSSLSNIPSWSNITWDTTSGVLKLNGSTTVLHGVNISCTQYIFKGFGMTCWTNYNGWNPVGITSLDCSQLQTLMQILTKSGVNAAIRLPMTAAYYIGDSISNIDTSGWGDVLTQLGSVSAACNQYRTFVDALVTYFTGNNVVVILDLHWNNSGTNHEQTCNGLPFGNSDGCLPCDYAQTFWSAVATNYSNNPYVFFELYNEPAISDSGITANSACSNVTTSSPGCSNSPGSDQAAYANAWLKGTSPADSVTPGVCSSYSGVVTLYNTIRDVAPKNVIIVGGRDWAYSYCDSLAFEAAAKPSNVMYTFHAYQGLGQGNEKNTPCLQYYIQQIQKMKNAQGKTGRPIIFTEFGQYCCPNQGDCSPYVSTNNIGYVEAVFQLAKSNNISWTAWSWTASQSCSYPAVNNSSSTGLYSSPSATSQGADYATLWGEYF